MLDLTDYFAVLAGVSDERVGGQQNDDSRDLVVLLALCRGLFEEATSELDTYAGTEGEPVIALPGFTSASLIPLTNPRAAADYTALLSKTSLYSDLTVLIEPCDIEGSELSYSASGIARVHSRSEVRHIVELNRKYRDLVASGRCVFLPRRLQYDFGTMSEDVRWVYTPPLLSSGAGNPYIPLNQAANPRDLFLYKHILLPYFPDMDLLQLARLRDEETDSFVRFTTFLRRRVRELGKVESTQQIDELIEEIDYEVAGLRLEAEKLQRSRALRQAKLASFSVSLGALLTSGSKAVAGIAGVVGSVTALELFKEYVEIRKAKIDLKKSDFYIPYLMSQHPDDHSP